MCVHVSHSRFTKNSLEEGIEGGWMAVLHQTLSSAFPS